MLVSRFKKNMSAFGALLLGLGVLYGAPALSASSSWNKTDHTEVRLISASDTIGGIRQVTLGLQFKLEKNWKVYWRSAGDAGYPPSIDWAGSSNFDSAIMQWPLPERFSILGFETLGYKKEVIFPITINIQNPGEDLLIKANVDYLACAELCIPYETDLELFIPKGSINQSAKASTEAHLISRHYARVPKSGQSAGMEIQSVEIKSNGDNGVLVVSATSRSDFTKPDLYVEGPDGLSFAKPLSWLDNTNKLAVLEVPLSGLKFLKKPITNTELTLTLSNTNNDGGTSGAEFKLTPTLVSPETLAISDLAGSSIKSGPSMIVILGFALLGGLILNLMPCVLPVLSIKLMGAISHGGGDKKIVRYSFMASAAGIIFSFLLLAGALVALKSAGAAVGWGIQFQQPWFLIAMALVITVFAANMWGFFEIHLPGSISEIGADLTHQHGLGGHFLTGAFATLLATPCSAPFLGTAVGFALARAPVDIFLVFSALGIGLAAPYISLAIWPGLATKMPRPGRWMVNLRKIMGFALAITAIWLVSILGVQVNPMTAWMVGAILALVVGVFWLHHRMGRRFGRLDLVAVGVLATLALLAPDTTGENGNAGGDLRALDGIWQPFNENAIPILVSNGKTVFVDVTAKWCLTCQINKAISLSQGEALARLKASDVVAMQADWTKPSDKISNYLASFGRYGIPFNAVYGPNAPGGIALPELLSQQIVIDALDKAKEK